MSESTSRAFERVMQHGARAERDLRVLLRRGLRHPGVDIAAVARLHRRRDRYVRWLRRAARLQRELHALCDQMQSDVADMLAPLADDEA